MSCKIAHVCCKAFFKCAISRPLWLFGLFNTVFQLTGNKCSIWILPMTGLKLRTSGVESDHSTYCVTTTALIYCSLGRPACLHCLISSLTVQHKNWRHLPTHKHNPHPFLFFVVGGSQVPFFIILQWVKLKPICSQTT